MTDQVSTPQEGNEPTPPDTETEEPLESGEGTQTITIDQPTIIVPEQDEEN